MIRDWLFGVAMAAAVALYPNLIDAILYHSGLDDIASKTWLVFFATAGPALFAPLLFGVRPQIDGGLKAQAQDLLPVGGMLAVLAISGMLATAYFFAVIGFGDQSGLGAGMAEMIDSSFFPIAYVGWLWLVSRSRFGGENVDRPSLTAIVGIIAAAMGLIILGASARLNQGYGSIARELLASTSSRVLVSCALIGAAGSAIALWSLRRLVRKGSVTLGVAISFRYGASALLCLILAAGRSEYRGLDGLGWTSCLVTAIAGGSLIVAIYFFAIRIESEVDQAAAMGLVPLLAVAFEIAGSELSLLERHVRINHLGFWVGAAIAISGIVLVWRDLAAQHRANSRR